MNNIKIRKKPFLFGNIPIVVAGEHYNIKYNGYKKEEAIDYAKKVLTNHDKKMGDLELKAKAW